MLDLSFNELSGPLAGALDFMTSLMDVDLQNNSLTGPIPSEPALLPSLSTIQLQDNAFGGTVPLELCTVVKVYDLRLVVDLDEVECCPGGGSQPHPLLQQSEITREMSLQEHLALCPHLMGNFPRLV